MRRVLTICTVAFLLTTTFVLIVRLLTVIQFFNYNFVTSLPHMFSPHWQALQGSPRARDLYRHSLTTCTILALIALVSYLAWRFAMRRPSNAARWRRSATHAFEIATIIFAVSAATILFGSACYAGIRLPFGGLLGVSDSGIYLCSESGTERRAWVEVWDFPASFEFWAFSFVDGPYMLKLPIWMLALAIAAPAATFLLASRRPLPGHCLCGYNLTGNNSGICPECGTATDRSNSASPPPEAPA